MIYLKKIPVWLTALLILGVVYAIGFPLNDFITDRRSFNERPITQRDQPIEKLLGLKSPEGMYDFHSVGRGSTVSQFAFSAKELEIKRFLASIRATPPTDDFDIRSKMNFWGCQIFLSCPVPWWNSSVPRDGKYVALHDSILFFITTNPVENTGRRINLLAIKQPSP